MQPGLPTIQGILAECIGRATGENVVPQGSGRTDAGVHALGQVASFTIENPMPAPNLKIALNDLLPAGIRVLEAVEVPVEFHARHSARCKQYRYRILRSEICPPHLARYVYHFPYPLNECEMQLAAKMVTGEHDFTSFAAVDPEKGKGPTSNVRTILDSSFERIGEELVYTVEGNGFLHHMVRNLVGTFLLAGKGTIKPDDVVRILKRSDRSAAGATVPASGLWLMRVDY